MITGAAPLKKGIVSTKAEIKAVLNQPSGKLVEVVGTIYREGKPVMEVTSQFLYRGEYNDYCNTFQKVTETPVQVAFKSAKDLAVLRSKEWFHLEKDVQFDVLTFRCESTYKFKSANVYSSIKTTGQVLLELPTKEVIQVGSVDYEAGTSYGNPVTDYLSRNGKTIEESVIFENAIPLSSGEELTSKAPGTNEPYAIVSGDYNQFTFQEFLLLMLNCQVLSLMECTRLLRSEHWLKNGLPTMLPQELEHSSVISLVWYCQMILCKLPWNMLV